MCTSRTTREASSCGSPRTARPPSLPVSRTLGAATATITRRHPLRDRAAVARDASGALFIAADTPLLRVAPSGAIDVLVAGAASSAADGNGCDAGVSFDGMALSGHRLYVADAVNVSVRVVELRSYSARARKSRTACAKASGCSNGKRWPQSGRTTKCGRLSCATRGTASCQPAQ